MPLYIVVMWDVRCLFRDKHTSEDMPNLDTLTHTDMMLPGIFQISCSSRVSQFFNWFRCILFSLQLQIRNFTDQLRSSEHFCLFLFKGLLVAIVPMKCCTMWSEGYFWCGWEWVHPEESEPAVSSQHCLCVCLFTTDRCWHTTMLRMCKADKKRLCLFPPRRIQGSVWCYSSISNWNLFF